MSKRITFLAIAVACMAFNAAPFAAAAGSKSTDSIWIVTTSASAPTSGQPTLHFNDTFNAGYSSRAKQPWAYAQCVANSTTILGTPNQGVYTPGDTIWSAYRSLTGLTGDTFDLNDPIQGLWRGGGADCTLSLVTFNGSGQQSVLASISFTVSA